MITKLRTQLSILREALRREKQRRILGELSMRTGLGPGACILHGWVLANHPKVVVEIGSASGWSACVVGSALKANGAGKLYAIDPHMTTAWNDGTLVDTYPVMSANLQRLGLEEYVEIILQTSQEAARGWVRQIDMIFIDGDHSYEGVKSDWELFLPHMNPFTLVVFHDTIWEVGEVKEEYRREDMGVPRFVDELRQQGYPVVTSPANCGVSLVQPVIGGTRLRK
jgi:predicted O-methyltransferase YrrM